MQSKEIYERLRELLDKHPTGCPPALEIYEIFKILFTDEEAKVACGMVFIPKPVEWIAKRAEVSPEEAKIRLESLANKGIIYAREKEGEWGYALLPVMPGIFEFPYMKGERTETLERLSRLWKSYLPKISKEFGVPGVGFSRIIPIQEEIVNMPGILTYEMLYNLIDKAKAVGIAHCACRESENKCDAPREACMLFDETCDFLVKRGFARYITKEEMKEKLREFDRLGLVHQVNNSKDKLTFVCNCCPCCCGLLRALTEFGNPHVVTNSGFIPEVDAEICTGCATCADERCPLQAIEIVDEIAKIDKDRCIGCGLCVTGCPSEALKLVRREGVPEPANTIREMGLKILEGKNKLEEFIKLYTAF